MTNNLKTADEVIKEISETLAESSNEFIEYIANKVLTNKVIYIEDNMYTQKNLEE